MRKNLKSTVAILLAATLLTGNTGFAQLALSDTITESISNKTVFTVKAAVKKQSKADEKAKSKKNKKAHIAYEKKIQSVVNKESVYNPPYYYPYFGYLDINDDGIDECIILADSGEDENKKKIQLYSNMIAVYTYYKGKVRKVLYYMAGGNSETGYVNKKQKCIYHYYHVSDSEYTIYKKEIKKGKVKKVAVYKSIPLFNKDGSYKYDKYGGHVCKYTIDGKRVSEKKFEKVKSRALRSAKITMYKPTEKNMKKLR